MIVLITCLTTAMLALFCSVLFKKTSHAMMTTYMVIIVLFCAPLAVQFLRRDVLPLRTPNRPPIVGIASPALSAPSPRPSTCRSIWG